MNNINYLEKYGPKLIYLGYKIIPLVDRKKYPKEPGWQKIESKSSDIPKWLDKGYTGIGVLCSTTPAVDLDIRNKDLSIWMKDRVFEIAGQAPIRVGMAPKALLPFKTLKPFRKMSSKKYEAPDDSLHQVEILAKEINSWLMVSILTLTSRTSGVTLWWASSGTTSPHLTGCRRKRLSIFLKPNVKDGVGKPLPAGRV